MRLRLLCAVLLANLWSVLASAGTITGTVNKPNGQPLANGVISLSLSQSAVTQTGLITVTSDNIYCGTDSNGLVVGVTNPGLSAVLSANYASGTLPATTYYVEFTYTSASGESAPSPETTFLMTSSGTLNGNAPTVQPGNATGYKVYIGTSSGTETLQVTQVGFAGWSQSSPLAGGASPPVSNSTTCSPIYFNDALIPSYTTYSINLLDTKGKQVAGYPQRYYLAGSTVDLSTLAPAGNLFARFPFAIVAQPAGNGLQSIAGPLSLGTNPFTAGAGTFSGPLTIGGLAIFNGGQQYPFVQSATVNPALTGFLRLADADTICWRNHANSADLCISKNTSDKFVIPSASLDSPTSTGTDNGTETLSNKTLASPAITGTIPSYNSIATVGNGIASQVALVDLTAQSAAVGTTTLYSVPSSGAGQYRVIWNSKITTAAGTSSTLGPLTITYTDPDGTVTSTTMPGVGANPSTGIGESVTGNTTGTMLLGFSILLNCKASTVIQYSFGYASNASNAMQYNLHIRLEAM